jgi:hypothetical protein
VLARVYLTQPLTPYLVTRNFVVPDNVLQAAFLDTD